MKKCSICGKKHNRDSKYCSESCADKAYKIRKKNELIAARIKAENGIIFVDDGSSGETQSKKNPAQEEMKKIFDELGVRMVYSPNPWISRLFWDFYFGQESE